MKDMMCFSQRVVNQNNFFKYVTVQCMNQTYDQGSVVERADDDIQWINSYPGVRGLFSGWRYLTFEQPRLNVECNSNKISNMKGKKRNNKHQVSNTRFNIQLTHLLTVPEELHHSPQ